MELTEREKKIIHIMHVLINQNLREVPQDVRENTLKSQLFCRDIKYDESDITDIVLAINQETKETLQNAYAKLHKFAPMLKGLNSL